MSRGFTIVELLIIIVIIGILSALALATYSNTQAKARDSQRLSDMKTIEKGLRTYGSINNRFPTASGIHPGAWEASSDTPGTFLSDLVTGKFLATVPVDPINTTTGGDSEGGVHYNYYRYDPVNIPAHQNYGCPLGKGAFVVLIVLNMEATTGPHPDSPGFACTNRNWQNEGEWVMGMYEGDL